MVHRGRRRERGLAAQVGGPPPWPVDLRFAVMPAGARGRAAAGRDYGFQEAAAAEVFGALCRLPKIVVEREK